MGLRGGGEHAAVALSFREVSDEQTHIHTHTKHIHTKTQKKKHAHTHTVNTHTVFHAPLTAMGNKYLKTRLRTNQRSDAVPEREA